MIVTPEHEPLLALAERVELGEGAGSESFPTEAPLGEVQRAGPRLLMPRRTIALDRIESAELVFGPESTVEALAPWNEEDVGCKRAYRIPERYEYIDGKPRTDFSNPFERRHYLGLQIGGTGAFQIAYRVRAAGRLHVDMGAFGASGGVNTSAGLLYDFVLGARNTLYVGSGVGMLGAFGEGACEEKPEDAQYSTGSVWAFLYLRAGVGVRLGRLRRDVLGLDAGVWHGIVDDGLREEAFTWPMAGFSYHYAL